MTILELHNQVQLALQKISAFAIENFQDEEVTNYLNQAQLQIIKDRYRGVNEVGFEEVLYRIGDLQTLVSTGISIPVLDSTIPTIGSTGEYLIPYPADYMYFVEAEASITRTNYPTIATAEYVPTKVITHDQLKYYRTTTQHKPFIRLPGLLFRESFIHCFVDQETTLSNARLVYIRFPDDMLLDRTTTANSVDPELPEHLHQDIVNLAVTLMLGDIANNPQKRDQLEAEQN